MIVFKRFIIVSQEIYAMIMLAAFALGGILAAQPAAAQSIPNVGFAGSDIKIPIPTY
jgi:hypothetical protein